MKCKNTGKAVVLDYYGELPSAESAELEAHLRECPACQAERGEIIRVFALLEANPPEPVPEPDAERVWKRVEFNLDPRRAPQARPAWGGRRWSLAGAAAVLIIAGIFIGRSFFAPQITDSPLASTSSTTGRPGAGLKSVLAGHLEDMKPLFLEYANYSADSDSSRTVAIEENLLKALLLQNILLRDALAKSDPAAASLLDDCDLILKEILNRNRPTSASPVMIRDLIADRDVLFKLEILKKS